MLKPDNDSIFSNKFRDFEPEHGDRWSQIEAALPKEKKRRGFLWLWLGLGLIAGGSALMLLQTPKTEQTQNTETETERERVEKVNAQQTENEAGKEQQPEEKYTLIYSPPALIPWEINNEIVMPKGLPDEWHGCGTSAYRNMTHPQLPPFPGLIIDPEARVHSTQVSVPADSVSPAQEITPEPPLLSEGKKQDKGKEKNKQKPAVENRVGKWSMGFGLGVYASRFTPKMPASVGNYDQVNEEMVSNNQKLREQIEKPGYSFSQSLWIEYQATPRLSFSTGVSMVQTTQVLRFAIKGNSPDNVQSPGDFPESGNTGPGGVYLHPNDSILAGSGFGANNKYYAREIPFFVSYRHPLNERFSLDINAGASYRWVRSLSVYLPDIDNVGMVYMQGPEYYPGIKSTFQLQGGVGLSYQVNDYFRLQAMPTFQMALQSNMRFEHYVQQYQKQWGCQFILTRKLGF